MGEMKVQTELKFHNNRWIAYDADTYGAERNPLGVGDTEEEAIADLMEQLEEA
jgi:hypothetical protein